MSLVGLLPMKPATNYVSIEDEKRFKPPSAPSKVALATSLHFQGAARCSNQVPPWVTVAVNPCGMYCESGQSNLVELGRLGSTGLCPKQRENHEARSPTPDLPRHGWASNGGPSEMGFNMF